MVTGHTPQNDYQRGWNDATAAAKQQLAHILRTFAVGSGNDPEDELLTDALVRDIFTGAFDVRSCDLEFGPEPTGNIDLAMIMARQRQHA